METTTANVLSPASRSDCNLNWMTRVPSPFPPGVVEHLPPDGRLHHQRRLAETAAVAAEAANMMNYPVQQPKVLMARTTAKMEASELRRAPPPPPPRGVTLRTASSVVGTTPIGTSHPPSLIPVSVTSAVNRLHLKSANVVSPTATAPVTKVMKENLPAELVAGLPVQLQQQQQQQQHHPQGYLETRYAYSVNGILGSAAQASAAAAFFARASQKLNLASPQRRKRHGSSDGAESPLPAAVHRFGTDFSGLLRRNPPLPPPHLLRRLGLRENPGVGKVRVMLRVAGDPTTSNFLSVDKKRKQLTLQEPGNNTSLTLASSSSSEKDHHQVAAEDRRVGVAAPKMFAFDGLFTAADDSQGDVAASVLSDIVTAVINGSDGCVFCFGHAQLGKTTTMVGSCSEDIGPGLMPTAIAWLFRGIGEQKNKTGARFSVRVSAVEIAGPAEVLRDLLAPHATESEESPGVYLRDDPLLGTQLQNQSELRAPTAEKAAFYLDAALAARTDSSSPDARFSHLLYTLHVYQYSVDRTPNRTGGHCSSNSGASGVAGGRSRLHLLDLGSCQQSGRAVTNGQSANTMTLSGLGNVLVALFNGQRHLPHREHKITQVLRECLGSLTCQAALVAHVAASSAYSETLATVQMASRVHRMRRRRMKYNNAGSGGSGSGGSSEDSSRLGLSRSSGGESSTGGSADPSSSEQSCDTVIYVGPIDDATDGEHPPVYLPSLNSGDHRCSMSRALRGSTVDRPAVQQQSGRSPVHHAKKETSTSAAPSRSPQIQRKVAKCDPAQQTNKQSGSVAGSNNEEQWIDGPRFNKTRISQARMQVVRHQREMWVDGPPVDPAVQMLPAVLPAVAPPVNQTPLGYGFMDQHKQGMIRQWVENQSVQQRHPAVRTSGQMWIDAQPRPAPEPGTPVKVLTVFKTCPDDEDEAKEVDNVAPVENIRSPRANRHPTPVRQSRRKAEPLLTEEVTAPPNPEQSVSEEKLNSLSGVGSINVESVEPTASSLTLEQLYSQCEQLADSLVQEEERAAVEDSSTDGASDDLSAALDVTSEQVSISCDSWRRVRHRDDDDNNTVTDFKVSESESANQRGRLHHSPMHGRGGDYSPEYIEVEEPDEPVPTQDSCLQVTEEDIAFSMMEALEAKCNDVRSLSSYTDGEEHPLRALSHDNLTIISHFTGETYSQGTASEWEPIGSSIFDPMPSSSAVDNTEFYQTQLEQLAKLHQQIYQQSIAGNAAGTLHPTPLSALTNCNIGSFKDLPLLTQDWNNVAVRASPGRNGMGQDTRKAMVSTIGMELERELGIQDAHQASILSSLRHPDGASDPHLDQHSGKPYESVRLCEPQQQERLPGNGASTSDPEEEVAIKSNSANMVVTTGDLVPERDCKAVVLESNTEHEKVIHHKTPKLSRFFSGSKNKQQPSSVTKRNTATSMSGSPVPTPKASSSSAKASPKVEKRSKSRENTSKHNSPAKSLSKSPSRIDPTPSVSIPPSPKSQSSKSSNKKDKLKASSSHKSPKKDSKSSWDGKSSGSKRDVKSYGFSYESCHQTAPSSLCPSEGYESGGSDSGVHLSAVSPIKNRRHAQQIQQQQQIRRQHLMPIGEMSRKNFSSGTSTSGSGGSGGSAGHYESSGYESVIRDSECSSLGSSSQDSDREAVPLDLAISTGKQAAAIGQSSSCTIL